MKRQLVVFLVLAGLSLLPVPRLQAAQTAQVRMFCCSLRFHQVRDQDSGEYLLNLTTLDAGENGELVPSWGGEYTHWSYIDMYDDVWEWTYYGMLDLSVPDAGDANADGFDDFFDVSQPVNGLSSSGSYDIQGWGSGTFTATWSRPAGSAVGSCTLKFKSGFQTFTFSPSFEVLEYTGTLMYTPGTTAVAGTVNLMQTGYPDGQWHGPVELIKEPSDPLNKLMLQTGAWTNASEQTLTFTEDLFQHDPFYPTNYYGYFDFDDGDLSTADTDYQTWVVSIDDPHDANHNKIPDLSDTPQSVLPRQPLLSLVNAKTNLLLTIRGDVGHVHKVEEAISLANPSWQTAATVTLTNDPQVVALPLPSSAGRFWRVKAE